MQLPANGDQSSQLELWCDTTVGFATLFFRGKRPKLTLEILVYLFFSAALGYNLKTTCWYHIEVRIL